MKTTNIKGLKLALAAMGMLILGAAATVPALADGRRGDDCGRPEIRDECGSSVRQDNDRRGRDDHRVPDNGRYNRDGRDDHRPR